MVSLRCSSMQPATTLPSGSRYTPMVGWDVCDVLAHNGIPTSSSTVATSSGRAEHWYYTGNTMSGLIVMVPGKNGRKVVESVVW